MAVFFHSRVFQGAASVIHDRALNFAFAAIPSRRLGAVWEIAADGRPARRWRAAPPPD